MLCPLSSVAVRILLVEDEQKLAQSIKKGLTENGFAVDLAHDGEEGLDNALAENYDVIILDLGLPKLDGLTLCKKLRTEKNFTPILMLTAKTRTEDKVIGLDCGADDYLTKPFEFVELRSRLNALLRRKFQTVDPILNVDGLEVDPGKRTVTRDGKNISLTPKEFSILEYLLRSQGQTVTRSQIIEHVWDFDSDTLSNVVDVFIASLRKKIDNGRNLKLIKTVHGVGYKISDV